MTIEELHYGMNENAIDDLKNNNLNSLQDYYDFFRAFIAFYKLGDKQEEIEFCINKLKYLGFIHTGEIKFVYGDENSVCDALVQVAFMYYMNIDKKRAYFMMEFLLDMLYCTLKEQADSKRN